MKPWFVRKWRKAFLYQLAVDSKIFVGPPTKYVREKLKGEDGFYVSWTRREVKVGNTQLVTEMPVSQATAEGRIFLYIYWRGLRRNFAFTRLSREYPPHIRSMLKITIDGIVETPVCYICPEFFVLTEESIMKAHKLRPGMYVYYITDPYPLTGYFLKIKEIEEVRKYVKLIVTTAMLTSVDRLVVRGRSVSPWLLSKQKQEEVWKNCARPPEDVPYVTTSEYMMNTGDASFARSIEQKQ